MPALGPRLGEAAAPPLDQGLVEVVAFLTIPTRADAMLISTTAPESDPRTMCGIIAKTALSLMDAPQNPAAGAVEATWLRILEMYRYGAFRHTGVPRGMFDFEPIAQQPELMQRDAGLDLQEAIRRVHEAMEPDRSGEEFAASISDAVRACFGSQDAVLRQSKSDQLRKFLKLFQSSIAQP